MDDANACEHLIRIAVLESQLVDLKDRIVVQAKEYERRLSELNHSHEQQMDRNSEYVNRETWELRNVEIDKWRREIDQWRWISMGGGFAGGAVIAFVMKILGS